MISFRKPSDDSIRRHLADQASCNFTYHQQGVTNSKILVNGPRGFVVDHMRIELGSGKAIFDAATRALCNWQQFAIGWLEATPCDVPIREGTVIAIVARALGMWSLNCARIVYTVDDQDGPIRCFGFACGTLPDHVESGEERFLIEWDVRADVVYYDILAVSRPRHILAKLAYPWVRRMQRRFGRDSVAAMASAVRSGV